jgi:poly(A) polymerase
MANRPIPGVRLESLTYERMPESQPQRQFAVEVVRKLRDAGFVALWAGGCVRDLLLGKLPEDYDVATDARPEQVQQLFGHRQTRAVGASFGVILIHGPNRGAGDVEVATFRTEGVYLDGRRPESVAFCSPEEDAQRRDFTINGMFYDPIAEQVLDFVDGQRDLAAGVVRANGDPRARFNEDKLRMLRAVRFTATLAFQIDVPTADAVRDLASEILIVSQERIAQELKRMLVHPNRRRAVELASDVRLLEAILPEVAPPLPTTLAMLELLGGPSFELAMATLLHAVSPEIPHVVRGICRRLKLSNDETEHITRLVTERQVLFDAAHLPLSKLKRFWTSTQPRCRDFIEINRTEAIATGSSLAAVEFCERYLCDTPAAEINPPPLVTGDDLVRRGFKPGPNFKQLLDQIRDAQLDGRTSTPDEAWALIQQLQRDAGHAKN